MSILTACATTVEEAESSEDSDLFGVTAQSLTAADDHAPVVPASLAGNPDAMKLARVPPSTYVAFPKPKVTDWSGRSRTRIVVKFAEGSRLRLRGTQLAVDLASASSALQTKDVERLSRSGLTRASVASGLARVNDAIALMRGAKIERLIPQTEAELEELKTNGENNTGRELGDLNLLYEVSVAEADAPSLIEMLNASELVEIAYPASDAPDPAQDLSPTTPSMLANQTYLDRAPWMPNQAGGVDARFAWTRTGGNGSNLRILDVEQGWNISHEDLGAGGNNTPTVSLRFNGCVNNGSAANCPMGAPCHGTAAIGIVRGVNNTFGITGIAHGAQYGIAGVWATSACNSRSTSAAVTAAAMSPNTQSGDVILIEQQVSGGQTCPGDGSNPCGGATCQSQFGSVPSEFDTDVFMAVQTATANGRIVVAAAGNGEQNLDSAVYGGKFDRSVRDSGAILVGSGSPTTHQPDCTSNAGSIVDVQGWGSGLRTLGYGDIQQNGSGDQNQWYATGFGGTSGASAMIAAVATVWQSACKAGNVQGLCTTAGQTYPPYAYGVRELLTLFASPQPTPVTRKIGPLPDLRFALAQFEPPALGAVAAAKWTSIKNVVFAVDTSGSLRMRTKDGAAAWTAPAAVPGGEMQFSPGAPIATGFPVSTELRVFGVGNNGQMRFSRSSSGGAFTTVATIGAANAAPAYAHVATGVRNTNQLHVFWVDASSRLMAFSATGTSTSFTGPTVIATNFAPPGAPLAAARQSTSQLDVFAIGTNGALRVAYASDGGSWSVLDLSGTNVAPVWNGTTRTGGGVATGRQPGDQLDAFYVGNGGTMQSMFVSGLGFWFGPVALHSTATFPPGALISTANHGTNTLDVFAKTSSNNLISFMRVVGTGSWSGPTSVTNTSGQLIDSSFTAAANRSTNLLDLIAIGSNGISISTSTSGGSYSAFSKLP